MPSSARRWTASSRIGIPPPSGSMAIPAAGARGAAIVPSPADAIIGETLDGIITDWNPAAERLYGYTAEEAIGQHLSMLAPADMPHEPDRLPARGRAGERGG